jgi:hypothetical protein
VNDSDPAKSYAALRDETAAMLNLNADSASLVENLQVSLVAILRMEVDTLEGQVLAGDAADLKRLEIALGMLRQLLPEKSLVASPVAAPETRFGSSHRAKLKELIERTVLAPVIESPDEIERKRDILAREEMAATVAAGGSIEAPSAPAIVAPPPPPERPANVVPLHYLKENQREPWESHYDGRAGPHPWPLPR